MNYFSKNQYLESSTKNPVGYVTTLDHDDLDNGGNFSSICAEAGTYLGEDRLTIQRLRNLPEDSDDADVMQVISTKQ